MLPFRIVGRVLVGAGMGQALRMWWLDQSMQRYRVPGASSADYLFVPVRWQRRLYTDAGQPLVAGAWRAMLRMYALVLLGWIVLAIGSPGG